MIFSTVVAIGARLAHLAVTTTETTGAMTAEIDINI